MFKELIQSYYPLLIEQNQALLFTLIIVNALMSALLALAIVFLVPRRLRHNPGRLWLLIFSCGFFIPVLGVVGIVAAFIASVICSPPRYRERFTCIDAPQFNPAGWEKHIRAGSDAKKRVERSVLALQKMPTAVASPILRKLLTDPIDDIRVIAFGMLDSREKKITNQITGLRPLLESAQSERDRYRYTRLLAELYWELGYSQMVQGDLRRHALEQALYYVEQLLAMAQKKDAGLLFLLARIKYESGKDDEAEHYFQQSLALGLPSTQGMPYLAELAFKHKDFAQVRALMDKLADAPVTPRLFSVLEYWTHISPETRGA